GTGEAPLLAGLRVSLGRLQRRCRAEIATRSARLGRGRQPGTGLSPRLPDKKSAGQEQEASRCTSQETHHRKSPQPRRFGTGANSVSDTLLSTVVTVFRSADGAAAS